MIHKLDPQRFIEAEIPIVRIHTSQADQQEIKLYLKREDLVHPRISGNKWRKLKYNLIEAKDTKKETLLTFGGAFSNHIAAVAEAGNLFDFKTIVVIRGEAPQVLNPTLKKVIEKGMHLKFISRSLYRDKEAALRKIKFDVNSTYIIPEGGTNTQALKGTAEIIRTTALAKNFDYWCTTCGTGGTAAGMITALKSGQSLLGFPVLKGGFMKDAIQSLLESAECDSPQWKIIEDYHFGGYAKHTPDLIEFINNFKKTYGIALDPIYTGKMVYGVFDLIKKGYFKAGSNIMMIHTGGLQGIAGFNQRYGNLIH